MNSPTFYGHSGTEYTRSVAKASERDYRQYYATLPGSTASYGERIQSVHSKITLTYSLT